MNSAAAPASFLAVNSLRMVQVGLGPHGRNWARQVLPQISEIDVVAYVDTDPYALDALRQEAGVPADRCFESLKEAVAATEPVALLNTTALPGHVPVTRAAFDAGLHVLVEKPFAPSLDAAEQLVDAAAARNLILMVSQNYRFFPAPRAIAALVREETLGKLHEVSIDFRRFSTAGPNGRGRRRHAGRGRDPAAQRQAADGCAAAPAANGYVGHSYRVRARDQIAQRAGDVGPRQPRHDRLDGRGGRIRYAARACDDLSHWENDPRSSRE